MDCGKIIVEYKGGITMDLTWNIIRILIIAIVLINEIAALITVFREKRDIAATWAWLPI